MLQRDCHHHASASWALCIFNKTTKMVTLRDFSGKFGVQYPYQQQSVVYFTKQERLLQTLSKPTTGRHLAMALWLPRKIRGVDIPRGHWIFRQKYLGSKRIIWRWLGRNTVHLSWVRGHGNVLCECFCRICVCKNLRLPSSIYSLPSCSLYVTVPRDPSMMVLEARKQWEGALGRTLCTLRCFCAKAL